MQDLVDTVGLRDLVAPFEQETHDFELLYDRLVQSGKHGKLVTTIENRVQGYFADLRITEGPTIYDRLLLALRKKDVVATFNWDPLLYQAYLRNQHVFDLPKVLFLHGNVGVGVCDAGGLIGAASSICNHCDKAFDDLPLLYPIAEKDYVSNPYIQWCWEAIQKALGRAYFLTIFGYRAPESDSRAIGLFEDAWKDKDKGLSEMAEVEIVDIRPRAELVESWNRFFVREHYGISDQIDQTWLFQHARRSCETFFQATMMNDPWPDRPIPAPQTLDELHKWVQPLVEEERREGDFAAPKPPL